MAERIHRMIGVFQRTDSLHIILSWWDKEPGDNDPIKFRHLDYPRGVLTNSVTKAIGILSPKFAIDLSADNSIWARSDYLDEQADKFDLIADAQEPEQALVSRYILEQ